LSVKRGTKLGFFGHSKNKIDDKLSFINESDPTKFAELQQIIVDLEKKSVKVK
jgi:hypothetical protein